MSDPSPWINEDYLEYVREFDRIRRRGELPPWYEALEFDAWLSRQPMRYLEGRGGPVRPY